MFEDYITMCLPYFYQFTFTNKLLHNIASALLTWRLTGEGGVPWGAGGGWGTEGDAAWV